MLNIAFYNRKFQKEIFFNVEFLLILNNCNTQNIMKI